VSARQSFSRWFRRLFLEKTLGQRGEAAAARYLLRRGYKILARGDRFGPGELDLVALDRKAAGGRTVVFVEVKTRQSSERGRPGEAVDRRKQEKLTRLAATFLKRYGLQSLPARFDIIAITWPAEKWLPVIEHIENAFEAVE
jgi:putative endonuclease